MPGAEFFKEQFFGRMIDTTTPLNNKVVIVTGSNQGLGFEAALQLAALNPSRLVLAVRDTVKGETAASKIRDKTGLSNVDVWKLDLSSFASVNAFVEKCERQLERLDILLENAGVAAGSFVKTEDGWESSLQTNGLSTGLLGVALLPLMAKTAERFPSSFKPHLTIVGSEVHADAQYTEKSAEGSVLEALNTQSYYDTGDRYPVTKLLSLFLARKISALPLAKNVVVNVVNPGLCVSELGRELPSYVRFMMWAMSRTTEQGAKNLTWAATQETPPGAYVSVCAAKKPSAWSTSAEGLEEETRVWGEMVELWQKTSPGLVSVQMCLYKSVL